MNIRLLLCSGNYVLVKLFILQDNMACPNTHAPEVVFLNITYNNITASSRIELILHVKYRIP